MKAIIGMKIEDGYLNFDPDATPDLNDDIMSWIENLAPEDMLHGLIRFKVKVEIEEPWGPDGPFLHALEVDDETA